MSASGGGEGGLVWCLLGWSPIVPGGWYRVSLLDLLRFRAGVAQVIWINAVEASLLGSFATVVPVENNFGNQEIVWQGLLKSS
jgi:hypothetical protein